MLAAVRWASNAGLRSDRSSSGTKPSDWNGFESSPVDRIQVALGVEVDLAADVAADAAVDRDVEDLLLAREVDLVADERNCETRR